MVDDTVLTVTGKSGMDFEPVARATSLSLSDDSAENQNAVDEVIPSAWCPSTRDHRRLEPPDR